MKPTLLAHDTSACRDVMNTSAQLIVTMHTSQSTKGMVDSPPDNASQLTPVRPRWIWVTWCRCGLSMCNCMDSWMYPTSHYRPFLSRMVIGDAGYRFFFPAYSQCIYWFTCGSFRHHLPCLPNILSCRESQPDAGSDPPMIHAPHTYKMYCMM